MNPFLHDTVARAVVAGGLTLAMTAQVYALDVNTASAQELEALRGVGPKTAQIIVQERQRGGNFESIEDLSDRVRGIGPKKAQALQAAGLTAGGSSDPSNGPSSSLQSADGGSQSGSHRGSRGVHRGAHPAPDMATP